MSTTSGWNGLVLEYPQREASNEWAAVVRCFEHGERDAGVLRTIHSHLHGCEFSNNGGIDAADWALQSPPSYRSGLLN